MDVLTSLANEIGGHIIHKGKCACGEVIFFEHINYKDFGQTPRELIDMHLARVVLAHLEHVGAII